MEKGIKRLFVVIFLTVITMVLMASTALAANVALTSSTSTLTNGNTYYLNGDVSRTGTFTVDTGAEVDIYLNGYTLSTSGSCSVITVNNNATLNLYDGTNTSNNDINGTTGMIGSYKSSPSYSVSNPTGGSSVTVTTGLITGGNTSNGGGIFVSSSGTVNMYGGTIAGNTATNQGGGVYVPSGGKFYMNGGTITCNSQTTSGTSSAYGGGGVFNASAFYMYKDAIISNNKANAHGGGIRQSSALYLYGGTISGNVSAELGDGVYRAATLRISGAPVVTQNGTNDSGGDGIYLYNGSTMTIYGELTTGASIYFTKSTNTSFSTGESIEFATSTAAYDVADSMFTTATDTGVTPGVVRTGSDSSYTYALEEVIIAASVTPSGSTATNFSTIEEAITEANKSSDSTVTLLDNCATTKAMSISSTVTLNLNGKTLSTTGSSPMISVNSGATLYLTDSQTSGGSITGGVTNNGTMYVSGSANITNGNGGLNLPTDKTVAINGALTGSIYVTAEDGAGAKIATDDNSYLSNASNFNGAYTVFYRTYEDSLYFAKATATANDFTVTVASSVTYDNTDKTAQVTVASKDGEMGTITKYYKLSGGSTYTETPTAAGTYDVCVSISGGDYYSATSSYIDTGYDLTISKATPTATTGVYVNEDTATSTTSTYQDKLHFSIALTAVNASYPTGTVTITATPSSGNAITLVTSATLSDGKYTSTDGFYQKLDADTYTITYTYSGDGNFNDETFAITNFVVAKKTVTIDVTENEASYQQGVSQGIIFEIPEDVDLSIADDFTVKYYEINENSASAENVITSGTYYTGGVITAATYVYVVSITDTNYEFANDFTSKYSGQYQYVDTADNSGFFMIYNIPVVEKTLNEIYFSSSYITDWVVGDTEKTVTLTNVQDADANATVAYESSDTAVATVNDETGEVKIVGTGAAIITATVSAEDYVSVSASYVIIVDPEVVVVTVTDKTVTYGTAIGGETTEQFEVKYTIGDTDVTTNFSTYAPTFTTTYAQGSNVGTYMVSASNLTSSDYVFVYQSGTLTVNPIALTAADFVAVVANKVYNGATSATGTVVTKVSETEYTSPIYGNDSLTVNFTVAYGDANVGTPTATFTITSLSGDKAGNYTYPATLTDEGEITQNPVTFTLGAISSAYTSSDQEMSITAKDDYGNVFTGFTVSYKQESQTATPNAVGDYDVIITLTDTGNYKFADSDDVTNVKFTITSIDQDYLAIVGTPGTIAFGDTFTLSTSGGAADGTATWEITSDGDYATIVPTTGAVTIKGVGTVTVKVSYAVANYVTKTATVTFTSTAKNVTISLSNLIQTYGVTSTFAATYMDNAGATQDATITYVDYTEAPTAVGTYSVVATVTGNYSGVAYGTVTIQKATVANTSDFTLIVADSSDEGDAITYGETYTATATVAEAYKDKFTVGTITYSTADGKAPKDAGEYTAYVTFTSDSYNSISIETPFKIEKATLTVSANDQTRAFGEANPTLTVTYSGFAYEENASVIDVPATATTEATVTSPITANDTSYAITVDVSGASDNNYKFTTDEDSDGTLTITAITDGTYVIVGNTNTLSIAETVQLYAYTSTGIQDDVTWSVSGDSIISISETGLVTAVGAGTATVTADYGANYNNQTATYLITVGKKAIELTVVGLENVVYDGKEHAVTFTYGDGDSKAFTDVIVTYRPVTGGSGTTTAPTDAGSYIVTYVIDSDSYTGSGVEVLYIDQGTFTGTSLTANNTVYGEDLDVSALEITATDGSKITPVITYSVGSTPVNAGTYTAYATYTDPNGNYKTVVLSQNFTIEKATITATAVNKTVSYDREIGALDITYTLDGEIITISDYSIDILPTAYTTATKGSAVATYPITVSGGTDNNYTFAYGEDATLTIEKADVSEDTLEIVGTKTWASVNEVFTVYGLVNQVITAVEWKSSNEAVATVDANGVVTALSAGQVTISATLNDSGYTGNTNTTDELTASFDLTVQLNNVELIVGNTNVTYNGVNQWVTFTTTTVGYTVNESDITVTYVDLTDYSIVDGTPRDAGTYSVSYVLNDETNFSSGTATMTIAKADVTVQPENKEKIYGNENPELTFFGLAGDDRSTYYADYAVMFELSTEADETSDVGGYDIVMVFAEGYNSSSARNYNITISSTNGTLDIIQRELFFTVSDVTRSYDEENPTPEYTVEGFVNGDGDDIDDDLIFTYLTKDETSGIGTYTNEITMSGFENDNYDISFGSAATLNITALTFTMSGSGKTGYITITLSEDVTGLNGTNFAAEGVTLTSVKENSAKSYTLYGSFIEKATYTISLNCASENITNPNNITVTISSTSSSGGSGGSISTSTSTTTEEDISIADTSTSDYGDLAVSTDSAASGEEITVTITPNDGFEVDDVQITDADGNEIEYTVDGNEYTFIMPSTEVSIHVSYVSDVFKFFVDVLESDWFYASVKEVVTHGLFNGTSETTFDPNENTSRNMIVTVLHRLDGDTASSISSSFTDVASEEWYTDAIYWATENGIVKGFADGTFKGTNAVTREDFVVILYRYAQYKGMDTSDIDYSQLEAFTDLDAISDYAYEAMAWAVDSGIISGYNLEISPKDTATRAEVSAVIVRIRF